MAAHRRLDRRRDDLQRFQEGLDIAARYPYQKSRRIQGTMRLLLVIIPCRVGSLYNDVINHTRITCVHVINTHVTAGFDRGSDGFARLVHNGTGPVENIPARIIIRAVHVNNERFEWLITGGRARASLSFSFDDRSRYRYWFCRSWPLPFTFRTRLRKCQRRNQCAAGEGKNCFLHYDASC
jgi:hypothetical protein